MYDDVPVSVKAQTNEVIMFVAMSFRVVVYIDERGHTRRIIYKRYMRRVIYKIYVGSYLQNICGKLSTKYMWEVIYKIYVERVTYKRDARKIVHVRRFETIDVL